MQSNERLSLFVTCPKALEHLLQQEIIELGCQESKLQFSGVQVTASIEQMYKICLWSRVANRVLLQVSQAKVLSKDFLYDAVKAVDWRLHLRNSGTFKVTFNGKVEGINNSLYGVQLIKDAICDHFREHTGSRPNISKQQPDIHINVHVHKNQANIYIDLSGDSLHRRGYKKAIGKAPVKENLAAALLLKSNWPELAKKGATLVDPTCGSGTFITEAMLIAADTAPGLYRTYWGFDRWLQHQPTIWQSLITEARQRRFEGQNTRCRFFAYDSDAGAISFTQDNVSALQLTTELTLKQQPLAALTFPAEANPELGLVICNPPYGERMSEKPQLIGLYNFIGRSIYQSFGRYHSALLTNDVELGFALNMRLKKKFNCLNGKLECVLLQFAPFATLDDKQKQGRVEHSVPQTTKLPVTQVSQSASITEEMTGFANRIKKNQKNLKNWLKQQQIHAYRLYDADLPEYACAIDIYGDKVHVQEYRAPKSVDEDKANQRLTQVIKLLPSLLQVPMASIYVKARDRQRGKQQYEKLSETTESFLINEYDARLEVNLSAYLDTGLFLDHRPIRKWIGKQVANKSFLNLFCYTASASVHAALGGASRTTSVDMSNTYIQWAQRNLANNGLSDAQHRCVVSDCFRFLKQDTQQYEIIFMDPPTFSNSKKMLGVLDIQRDHSELIELAMARLYPGGSLIFSNNFKKFKLDELIQQQFLVKDITAKTIDKDFARHNKIHACWQIQHKQTD